jgi:hypothetical protein
MTDILQNALKQLSKSEYYKVVYEEYIIPEMRKLLLLNTDELDINVRAEDYKIDTMSRVRAFKTLEEIFDKINNMNVPDVRVKEEDSMI